ncbi:MAG: aldo/keto reductase [Clostridia bacterium]|nr:aldo/keto reductase [Clostridia bacterium]
MILNETYKMNNGLGIPKIALGTWMIDDDKVAESVRQAVKIGYRHIDTAQGYENERGVGEGVRTCGVPREKIFVNSKVAAENKSYSSAKASIDESLKKMGLDYIDMMIIHSPQPWVEVNRSENRYFKENKEVWRAMEDAVREGKVKTIGVSNFLEEDIENILSDCKIRPAVNQVLSHISNTPFELIDYCKEKNILMEAYSPIAHGEILQNKEVNDIAKKYGVTVAQICIKYDLQLGMVVLPKTDNPEHMKTNADLDFLISEEDMETLKKIKLIDYGKSGVFPIFGGLWSWD